MHVERSDGHIGRRLAAAVASALAGLAVLAALAGGLPGAGAFPAQDTTGTSPPTTPDPTTTGPTTTTSAPATTAPTTTAPPATQPPATSPAATSGPTALVPSTTAGASDDDGADGGGVDDWGLVAVVAAVVAALAVALVVIGRTMGAGARGRDELGRHVAHLVAGARWVHDEGSLGVLSRTPSPDRLRVEWADTRRRVNDLAAEASEVAVTAPGDMSLELRHLAGALSQLESAIDQHVDLRLQPDAEGDTLVVDESALAVDERRHELRTAIAPLAARV